jgi:alkylhydroperoxidase family enzyme
MMRRGIAADRPNRLRKKAARVVEAVLTAQGAMSADARSAAFAGRADDPALARYVNVVRTHAYRITDEDVQRLRDTGLDDDAIFELTLAAAVGAGAERLQAGLSLLGRES